ncbi:hypothetical protein D3C84_1013570 [compost metagenome]
MLLFSVVVTILFSTCALQLANSTRAISKVIVLMVQVYNVAVLQWHYCSQPRIANGTKSIAHYAVHNPSHFGSFFL